MDTGQQDPVRLHIGFRSVTRRAHVGQRQRTVSVGLQYYAVLLCAATQCVLCALRRGGLRHIPPRCTVPRHFLSVALGCAVTHCFNGAAPHRILVTRTGCCSSLGEPWRLKVTRPPQHLQSAAGHQITSASGVGCRPPDHLRPCSRLQATSPSQPLESAAGHQSTSAPVVGCRSADHLSPCSRLQATRPT